MASIEGRMAWSADRSVVAGFSLAVIILVGLGVQAHRDISQLIETNLRVEQSHEILAEIGRFGAAVTEAEAGVRGYILTGNDEHLAPYHVGAVTAEQQIRRLGQLTAEHQTHRELLEILRRRTAETLTILKESVDTRKRLGPEGTWKTLLVTKAKERMDAFRWVVGAVQAAELDVLRRRRGEQADRLQRLAASVLFAGVVGSATVALAGVLLRRDILRRRKAEETLERASTKLTGWVDALDQRGRDVALLGEMGDLLQGCRQTEETSHVVAQFAPRLFPGASGFVGLLASSRVTLEVAATWGTTGPSVGRAFPASGCWAVRRSRLHAVDDPEAGPPCTHIAPDSQTGYLCAPLVAHGELLGILHVLDPPDEAVPGAVPKHVREARRQLAGSASQHIALALANLRLQETLRQQAIRDPLTSLFNRRYMEESLEREIRRAARGGTPVGIIMFDIDHFKRFNDTYGHDAGDTLLKAVASFLKAHVRGEDIPCRYGGEEFILILPGAPLEVSVQRAERLREGVKALEVAHDGQGLGRITASLGVALFRDHGTTGEAVLHAADVALYRAKQGGRDRVVVAG
jgi:diguanylate cyclase (GGDEF)-like protein